MNRHTNNRRFAGPIDGGALGSAALAIGVTLVLLFAACSTVQEAPQGSVAIPFPERSPAPAPSSASAPSPASVSARAAAPAMERADEIVVTGNRIGRDDFSSPNATVPVTTEEMRNLGVTSVAGELQRVARAEEQARRQGQQGQQGQQGPQSQQAAVAAPAAAAPQPGLAGGGGGGGAGGRSFAPLNQAPAQPIVDGSNARSPLSRVSPGEELWIISQPAADEMMAQVAEDALGPGVMIARFLPVSLPDQPAPTVYREIPLPLKHTDVDARVQGYVGTVDVTQQFENPYNEKIEAIYMFPLPEKAAVSEFVMTIGDRRIRGILRAKEEAQQIYTQARAQGYQASLLTQHRPNVFEQKVANIEPGKAIDINIRYTPCRSRTTGRHRTVPPCATSRPGRRAPMTSASLSSSTPVSRSRRSTRATSSRRAGAATTSSA
jgi:hypothetical protein